MANNVKTPEARLSFPNLLKTDKKGKFSASLLFKKGQNLDVLKDAVNALLNEKFGDKSKWPKGLRMPFRDQGEKDFPGYEEGAVFINARANRRPLVIDAQRNDILEEVELYAGAYVYASLTPFYYEAEGNKGVSFGLNAVQKIRDGEPLGGRPDVRGDFEVLEVKEDPFA